MSATEGDAIMKNTQEGKSVVRTPGKRLYQLFLFDCTDIPQLGDMSGISSDSEHKIAWAKNACEHGRILLLDSFIVCHATHEPVKTADEIEENIINVLMNATRIASRE